MGIAQAAASSLMGAPLATIACVLALLLLGRSVYRGSRLHGLGAVPGPLLPRLTSLWLNYHAFIGDECAAVHDLHDGYGPIVRTGPRSVDIADGSVLNAVYVDKGGFLKPDFYRNFDMDGHATIFSATDPAHRAPRARAVAALFSTASIRGAAGGHLGDSARGFVERLRREVDKAASQSSVVDILPVARGFALDAVTSYLMGRSYGACREDLSAAAEVAEEKPGRQGTGSESMSASSMVDAFVGVGKNWYLPTWAFQAYERIVGAISPDPDTDRSISCVDEFLAGVVAQAKRTVAHEEKTGETANSFPARLLKAGLPDDEVAAQCKDLIFAGTDSTAMNLATICFMLRKYPETYQALRREVLEADPGDDDLQSLPYLQAVIKEGLRLSMANPSRLPRVVPAGGFRYGSFVLPAGTVVSCTPYELHLNEGVFRDARVFRPERWLAGGDGPSDAMKRDMIPFGRGVRQCIARNLAMAELSKAVSLLAAEDALAGLRNVGEEIVIRQWFNSHVVSHRIELELC